MVGINFNLEDHQEISYALACLIHNLPIEYLGVPLGGSQRTREFWLPFIERCKKKLANWKANYLSFGGRITLIKAALSNLLVYYLLIFKVPKRIAHELEYMLKQFLCRGNFKPNFFFLFFLINNH